MRQRTASIFRADRQGFRAVAGGNISHGIALIGRIDDDEDGVLLAGLCPRALAREPLRQLRLCVGETGPSSPKRASAERLFLNAALGEERRRFVNVTVPAGG